MVKNDKGKKILTFVDKNNHMSIEIERKFLVLNDSYKRDALRSVSIAQGYLSTDTSRTVRVRTKGEKAFLTIKGQGSHTGMSRFEWEKEISVAEAKDLLALCLPGMIEKVRYEVPSGKHIIEVDEFNGVNKGLVVAEIEIQSETEDVLLPPWLGKEVTGDVKYYNAQLMQHPFQNW